MWKIEERETHPEEANRIWAGDIGSIARDEGFVYLATYLDLFTRKVVGFSVDDHMRTELLLNALQMVIGRQKVAHRGVSSQYAAAQYTDCLKALHITTSMSRKGNCYDNAFAESFFATLKKELVYKHRYNTKQEAKKSIFEYIEVYYNRKRIHYSIVYMTPVQFEDSLVA